MQIEMTVGQLVTIGDGRLVCPIDEVYKVLSRAVGESLMTHQLPRAMRHLEPYIKKQCPWIEDGLPDLDIEEEDSNQVREDKVFSWLQKIADQYGYSHTIEYSLDGWDRKNPIEEACDMVGSENVYVVDPDDLKDQP